MNSFHRPTLFQQVFQTEQQRTINSFHCILQPPHKWAFSLFFMCQLVGTEQLQQSNHLPCQSLTYYWHIHTFTPTPSLRGFIHDYVKLLVPFVPDGHMSQLMQPVEVLVKYRLRQVNTIKTNTLTVLLRAVSSFQHIIQHITLKPWSEFAGTEKLEENKELCCQFHSILYLI